jgi:hypothetical protein
MKIKTNAKISILRQVDPTRTLTLRKTFERKITKRFRWLKGQINKSIVTNDCFGLNTDQTTNVIQINEPIVKEKFAFNSNSEKVNLFMDWVQTQINDGILQTNIAQTLETTEEILSGFWCNTYIETAYKKGIIRARQELTNKGYNVPRLEGSFGLQPTFNSSIHSDTVKLLYTRVYEGLKGISNEMHKQIVGVLIKGIVEEDNPVKLATTILDRVDKIGITRARQLAQTEIIRAHHQATINEYERWGVNGVTILAEILTAGDDRVCPICKKAANKNNGFGKGVYTLKQVMGLIPFHVLCRCMCLPISVDDNKKLQEKIKKAA